MRKGFISYSHADRAICDALMKHLGDLHRTRLRIWRDPDLKPGDVWNDLIGWHIQRTHIGIVMVSADALKAGGFVPDIEIPLLRRGHKRGQTIIVPAIARPFDRAGAAAISAHEAIPEKGRALGADASEGEVDAWCAKVASELRALVEALPELQVHTFVVESKRDKAQASLDAVESCDAFYNLHHSLVNDCQKLLSGLQAALRAPRADIWAAVDGLAVKWATFRRDRLVADSLDGAARELEVDLAELLLALETEEYDWPPDLNRASQRPLLHRSANPELVSGLDEKLQRVEDEARIFGQPGEAHLVNMAQEVGDYAAIGRALLVGPLADVTGARHVVGNAERSIRIVEAEIEGLNEGYLHARDISNARMLKEAMSPSAERKLIPIPEMVAIAPGRFQMGAAKNEEGASDVERPQHEVEINYSFALGKHAVTFAEWDAAIAAGSNLEKPRDEGWGRDDRPVINVSWQDAMAYLAWLNERMGLVGSPNAYRLPSEAEWEYACRAGTITPFHFGATVTSKQANFDSTHTYGGVRERVFLHRTQPVGSYPPNAFGLYEMHGNVWEWCADHWHEDYTGAPVDGSVRVGGDSSRRVVRGGSWYYYPQSLRSANRGKGGTSKRDHGIGFRVARTL